MKVAYPLPLLSMTSYPSPHRPYLPLYMLPFIIMFLFPSLNVAHATLYSIEGVSSPVNVSILHRAERMQRRKKKTMSMPKVKKTAAQQTIERMTSGSFNEPTNPQEQLQILKNVLQQRSRDPLLKGFAEKHIGKMINDLTPKSGK